jgi:hypothetical protein
MLCWAAIAPAGAIAQENGEPEDFVRDVLGAIFGPNWNLSVHGGLTRHGTFLLQRPDDATSVDQERAVRTEGGYDIGGAAGVDILLRTGLRLSYTFASADLAFRDYSGDDSGVLDRDELGTLESHVAAVEIIRYMLPPSVAITPYATAGLVGAWWVLEDEAVMIEPTGGRTQFRVGGLVTIGMQANLTDALAVRLEASSASVRNPFTGRESYRANDGTTIDEPGRVGKSDYRFALVYSFGRPKIDLSSRRASS